jgi:hypothetical protein
MSGLSSARRPHGIVPRRRRGVHGAGAFDGGSGHATSAASIESWSSVVFARGLDDAALSASQFHVVDSADVEAPIEDDLYYGDSSHVVHIKPTSDLLADEIYLVTVDPGVQTASRWRAGASRSRPERWARLP